MVDSFPEERRAALRKILLDRVDRIWLLDRTGSLANRPWIDEDDLHVLMKLAGVTIEEIHAADALEPRPEDIEAMAEDIRRHLKIT